MILSTQVGKSKEEELNSSRPRPKPSDLRSAKKLTVGEPSPHEVTLDPDNPQHEVKERVPARHVTPISGGVPVPITGIDEILVADGRVLYQCVRQDDCRKTFDQAMSARGHMGAHSDITELRRKAAELDKIKERRSAASTQGAASRAAKKAGVQGARPTAVIVDEVTGPLNEADIESLPDDEIARRLGDDPDFLTVQALVTDYQDTLAKHAIERQRFEDMIIEAMYKVLGAIDPADAEDAARYREMIKLLGR